MAYRQRTLQFLLLKWVLCAETHSRRWQCCIQVLTVQCTYALRVQRQMTCDLHSLAKDALTWQGNVLGIPDPFVGPVARCGTWANCIDANTPFSAVQSSTACHLHDRPYNPATQDVSVFMTYIFDCDPHRIYEDSFHISNLALQPYSVSS